MVTKGLGEKVATVGYICGGLVGISAGLAGSYSYINYSEDHRDSIETSVHSIPVWESERSDLKGQLSVPLSEATRRSIETRISSLAERIDAHEYRIENNGFLGEKIGLYTMGLLVGALIWPATAGAGHAVIGRTLAKILDPNYTYVPADCGDEQDV